MKLPKLCDCCNGGVDKHNAAILSPSKHSGFLPEVKHEVFSDKIQIVVAGVKPS